MPPWDVWVCKYEKQHPKKTVSDESWDEVITQEYPSLAGKVQCPNPACNSWHTDPFMSDRRHCWTCGFVWKP